MELKENGCAIESNITVVMPLYNKDKLICNSLKSVCNQTVKPFELIIINDGSTDSSLQVATEYLKNKMIDYKIYSQKNKGVSAARNKGISLSRTNYIAFLDADDEWMPEFIEKAGSLINDYPDAALWGFSHNIYNEDTGLRNIGNVGLQGVRGYVNDFFNCSIKNNIANSSKVVVKKDKILRFGAFPDKAKVCEDLFVWIMLALNNKVAYEDYVAVTINQVSDSSRESRIGEVPYPIMFFSKNKEFHKLPVPAKRYIWKLHVLHVLGSCLSGNKKEALTRLHYGSVLFPYKNYFLYSFLLFPKSTFIKLRKFRHTYLNG